MDYGKDFPMHFHDVVCITLVEKGIECTEVEGKKLYNSTGHISLTQANQVHANPNINDHHYSFVTYYLSPEVLQYYNAGQAVYFSEQIIEDVRLYQQLLAWSKTTHSFQQREFEALIRKLVQFLYKGNTSRPTATQHLRQIEDILTYIEGHYDEKISLDRLAQIAGMKKFAFLRLFKKHTGLTPANYIIIKRLEKAKRALRQGRPIVDAVYDCGFYDQSHFHKYFKKFTGLTPAQYLSDCNILQDKAWRSS